MPRPPWQGFFVIRAKNTLSQQGHLRTLSFRGASTLFPEKLQNWTSHTDFRELRSLDLSVRVYRQAFQDLTRMAEDGIFQRLQQFSLLGFKDATGNDADVAFRDLLLALPPLTSFTDTMSVGKEGEPSAGSKAYWSVTPTP